MKVLSGSCIPFFRNREKHQKGLKKRNKLQKGKGSRSVEVKEEKRHNGAGYDSGGKKKCIKLNQLKWVECLFQEKLKVKNVGKGWKIYFRPN